MAHLLIVAQDERQRAAAVRTMLDEGVTVEVLGAPLDLRELTHRVRARPPQAIVALLAEDDRGRTCAAVRRACTAVAASCPLLAILPGETGLADALAHVADFLVEPFAAGELRARVRRLLGHPAEAAAAAAGGALQDHLGLEGVVGDAAAFAAVKAKLPLVARSDSTVLILGETGTGKEVVARAIHYLGPRAARPFIPVNCGAIPTELVENELFGHRGGAFTGARSRVPGLITEAEGGSLLLDEIDALPMPAQVKLLHFLQDKRYRALGSTTLARADVRIIAATNSDLEARTRAGAFRADLFYRLNIIPLGLPPLRERSDDVPLLVRHFLVKHAAPAGPADWIFDGEALAAMQAYAWPGNVRELENLIQQMVALTPPGPVGLDVLPERVRSTARVPAGLSFRAAKARAIARFEEEYTRRLLSDHGGNITQAARTASKDRRAFGRLVKKYGVGLDLPPDGRLRPASGR